MSTKKEFYVINDVFAGEILTNYDATSSEEWDWDGDDILDGDKISVINESARFSTKEEAKIACAIVEKTFKKSGLPANELDFRILKIATKTRITCSTVNEVEYE